MVRLDVALALVGCIVWVSGFMLWYLGSGAPYQQMHTDTMQSLREGTEARLLHDLEIRLNRVNQALDGQDRQDSFKEDTLVQRQRAMPPPRTNHMQNVLSQLMYWKSHPTLDTAQLRRFFPQHPDKYLIVELDRGGLNNIRLGFEHHVMVALITGRTLVVPPRMRWYLLDYGGSKGWSEYQNHKDNRLYKYTPPGDSHTGDYWDLNDLKRGIRWISTEDFINRVLKKELGTEYPLPSRWPPVAGGVNGRPYEGDNGWSDWYRAQFKSLEWDPLRHVVYFPTIKDVMSASKPTEMFRAGREVVEYSSAMAREKVLIMRDDDGRSDRTGTDSRFLGAVAGFVGFLGGEFGEQVAAHVIAQLGGMFAYSSIHIRRGDLQYEDAKTDALTTIRNIKSLVPPGSVLYMATDETDHGFFDALHKTYKLYQFRDFFRSEGGHVLSRYARKHGGIDRRRVGQIETVICAAGKVFVSSQSSTFSAVIQKLHGYLGAQDTNVYHHTHRGEKLGSTGKRARKPSNRVHGTDYMSENPIQWEEV